MKKIQGKQKWQPLQNENNKNRSNFFAGIKISKVNFFEVREQGMQRCTFEPVKNIYQTR